MVAVHLPQIWSTWRSRTSKGIACLRSTKLRSCPYAKACRTSPWRVPCTANPSTRPPARGPFADPPHLPRRSQVGNPVSRAEQYRRHVCSAVRALQTLDDAPVTEDDRAEPTVAFSVPEAREQSGGRTPEGEGDAAGEQGAERRHARPRPGSAPPLESTVSNHRSAWSQSVTTSRCSWRRWTWSWTGYGTQGSASTHSLTGWRPRAGRAPAGGRRRRCCGRRAPGPGARGGAGVAPRWCGHPQRRGSHRGTRASSRGRRRGTGARPGQRGMARVPWRRR